MRVNKTEVLKTTNMGVIALSLNVIDLFAGAGGLSNGFIQAGFKVIAAVEYDNQIAETYSRNHTNTRTIITDLRKITTNRLLDLAGISSQDVDLIIGGPPCQGFSQAGKRLVDDPRNQLFREFIRVLKDIQPGFFVMENVTNLMLMKRGTIKREIINEFEQAGYTVDARILFAADYGVPQKRKRAIFLGNKYGVPNSFPKPKLFEGNYVTVRQAIGDLIELNSEIPNHETKPLNKLDKLRISYVPEGGFAPDIPAKIRPKEAKRGGFFYDWYRRLDWDKPSRTIIATDKLYHPSENRKLSVRESARLQSFSDDFHFYGSLASQYKQVGNAVPPFLANAIATEVYNLIFQVKNGKKCYRDGQIEFCFNGEGSYFQKANGGQ